MSSVPTASVSSTTAALLGRVRFFAALGVAWLTLGFVAGQSLPYTLERPMTIAAANNGILALVLVPIGLVIATTAGLLISARRNTTRAVVLASGAVLIWVAPGGTVDAWLTLSRPDPGPPSGSVYWPLLIDYLAASIALLGVVKVVSLFGYGGSIQRTLRIREFLAESGRGVLALITTSAIAIGLMWPLMGSAVEETLRGQVWFAVAAAFAAGAAAAHNVTAARHALWYLLAPFAVGVLGIVVAGTNPVIGIPASYQHLDIIPAWWLARALPLEMLAAGWLGMSWALGWEQPAEEQERRPL